MKKAIICNRVTTSKTSVMLQDKEKVISCRLCTAAENGIMSETIGQTVVDALRSALFF